MAYDLFACNGILFNHESPLRPHRFVTRKIVSAAVRIAGGATERLSLGDTSIERDRVWAPDHVEATWRMLQQPTPSEFVIAAERGQAWLVDSPPGDRLRRSRTTSGGR